MPPISDSWSTEHFFAAIPVAELRRAQAWYERLLGRAPDLIPNDSEAAWQMIPGAWLVLVAGAGQPAGTSSHTLLLDDLDAFIAAATAARIDCAPVTLAGGATRRTELRDPDGNRLQVGQASRGAS